MKILSRSLFAAYLLVLLWLVLFKFSYDPFGVIRDLHTRTLNLVPFASGKGEMISNIVAFIPFGVMLSVNFKQARLVYRLAVIFAFSLGVEITQFVLAIGVTDVTDVIMNTFGGLIGLAAYDLAARYSNDGVLERIILIVGTFALLAVLYLRIFVIMVKY